MKSITFCHAFKQIVMLHETILHPDTLLIKSLYAFLIFDINADKLL
jgi:hypothetical protein